jgi:P-type Ca2+ transporter type 2C
MRRLLQTPPESHRAAVGWPGLTTAEAAARLRAEGRNETRQPAATSIPRKVLAQLTDPLIVLLPAAAVVTAATGDLTDTASSCWW